MQQTLSAYTPVLASIEQMRARYLDKREKLEATTSPEAQALGTIIEVLAENTRDSDVTFQRIQEKIYNMTHVLRHYETTGQKQNCQRTQRRLVVMKEARRELAPIAGYSQINLKGTSGASVWSKLNPSIDSDTAMMQATFQHPQTKRLTMARRSISQVWFELYDVEMRDKYKALVEKTTGYFRDHTSEYAKHSAYFDVFRALEKENPMQAIDKILDDCIQRQDAYGPAHKMFKFYNEKVNALNVAKADIAYIGVYK